MTSCELCGKNPAINNCEIEGTTMKVCQECTRFGKVKGRSNVKFVVKESKKQETKEPEYVFLSGYGLKVKNAREKLKLKPEEFAKKINERESLIHQIESEHLKPSVALAKKLEHALRIQIIEEVKTNVEIEKDESRSQGRKFSGSQGMTFADFIKKK